MFHPLEYNSSQSEKETNMSTSLDDLAKALADEAQAHHSRYAELSRIAQEAGYSQAAKFLRAIVAAETARARLYLKCFASPGCQTETFDYYICPQCGFAMDGGAPEKCPVCDTLGTLFERIS
jgi:rubrerythrin